MQSLPSLKLPRMALEVPTPETISVAAASRSGLMPELGLVLISVCFAVAGQVTLKAAMDQFGPIGEAQVSNPLHTVVRAVQQPLLWAGLVLFGISAVFWLVVLSRVPLSIAYPLVGVSYILVVLFAKLVLHESVPALRWIGVVVVALGIAVIGASFRRV